MASGGDVGEVVPALLGPQAELLLEHVQGEVIVGHADSIPEAWPSLIYQWRT